MCSSTLSVNCEKAEKATQRSPDCRSPYFAAVAGLWSAPGYPRERGDSQEGGNRRCLPSCAPARRQRRFRSLRKRPTPDGTIIKIDKYPQKGYTNLTRGYGGIGRRARFRFWCPRRAGSSPVTRTSKKNAVESLHSVFLLLIFTWTACSVPSAQSAPWLRWRAGACPHRSDLPHRMRQP